MDGSSAREPGISAAGQESGSKLRNGGIMHPNKFFSNVDMLTEAYIPGGVKNFLAAAHPMNFLHVPINLSVYKVKIHFTASKTKSIESEESA